MQFHTIGVDIAKNVFQIHAVDADEKVVLTRQLRRKQVLPFFEKLSSLNYSSRLFNHVDVGYGACLRPG